MKQDKVTPEDKAIIAVDPNQIPEELPILPLSDLVAFPTLNMSLAVPEKLLPFLEKAMGATIVPKNITGGGGAVGMSEALFSSKADGYTVTLPSNAVFGLEGLGNVPWKHSDFDTVARVITEDYSITVRADAPWKTLDEFIEYVKANPGKVAGRTNNGHGTSSQRIYAVETIRVR